MFCKNCGKEIKIGAKFCNNCGQKVSTKSRFVVSQTESVKNNEAVVQVEPIKSSVSEEKEGNFKKFLPFVVGALFLIAIFYLAFGNTSSDNKVNNSQNITRSVVNILCTSKSGESYGGSGTIMTDDGLILTNAHIIPQINEVPSISSKGCLITLPDEATGQLKEVYYGKPEITKGLSKDYDIATIRITSAFVDDDGESWGTFPNTFPVFQDASSCEGEIKLGDRVKVYGYPVTSGGYNLTITEGIVSSFSEDGFVLTSAKVDSGNSGGLAIDQDGCFIGIPSAVVEGNYQNLGVIIPPNMIEDFFNEVPAQTENWLISCNPDECYYNGKCLKNPPHSYCVENDPNNAWLCDVGYIESGNYCVDCSNASCNTSYPGSKFSYYDTDKNNCICDCPTGYEWNLGRTACIIHQKNGSEVCRDSYGFGSYWTGSYSGTGNYICDCEYGHVWNVNRDYCVIKESIDRICQTKYGYDSYYLGYTEDGKYMCK